MDQTPPIQTSPELPPVHTGSSGLKIALGILAGVIIIIGGGAAYYYFFYSPAPQNTVSTNSTSTETTDSGTSTPILPTSTNTSTATNSSQEPTTAEKELPQVSNVKDFKFSTSAKDLLVKNNFVVVPASYREFFSLYESNRYDQIPNFITSDSILHNYHLMFDQILKRLEEEKLAPELKNLNKLSLAQAEKNFTATQGTVWENAARRNLGFFTVASKLLDSTTKVDPFVKREVDRELALIEAHTEIAPSPVMNFGSTPSPEDANKEDYSQYIPRGHYAKTDLLKSYFKSMMWYGRLTLRFKNEDEIRSAALITLALNDKNALASWEKIYEPTSFLVGKSDDISVYQMKGVIEKVYGKNLTIQTLVKNPDKFSQLVTEVKKLEAPQINSIPIFDETIQPDREKEITGFRFMGQRFTIDAAIFQRLVAREVEGRMLPKGLDIPAALGSLEAYNILKAMDETKHKNYEENMEKLRTHLSSLKEDVWTQNLYWGWLYALRPLTEDKSAQEKTNTYPTFMKNQAWTRKDLNTFLGSWAELKHDTILYAKQVYAEMGGGPGDDLKKDDRGYVEPNRDVYYRLVGLIRKTKEGLTKRGIITPAVKDHLDKMDQLALSLKNIAEKELNNTPLSEEDYNLIRSYGGQLEHLWMEINKEDIEASSNTVENFLDQNPAAIIADVATDPNGQVLEVGTGHISEIYALVPVDGTLRIAKGGVYSYYEFAHPINDRLTDEKWRALLNSDNKPAMPSWTSNFVAQQ